MYRAFLAILNMSLTASFVIVVVLIARVLLRRAPKIASYALWAVVLFRLLVPVTVESVLSLIPFNAVTIPADIATQPSPRINSGIPFLNNAVSGALPAATPGALPAAMPENSANPLQIWTAVGAYVWMAGAAALLLYAIIGYIRLKRRVSSAVRVEGNVFMTDRVGSPFVLGLTHPRVYIPKGMDDAQAAHIIAHERTHIRRLDYLVSIAAFAALALHWFNPLVWAAYALMLRDMEGSCDEAVLRGAGEDIRCAYSSALLDFSSGNRQLSFPPAFGEHGVKGRVKNVLSFKKTPRIIFVAALAFVILLSVGFAVNRLSTPNGPPTITVKAGGAEIFYTVGINKWGGVAYDRLDVFQMQRERISHRDIPYVANGGQITITINGKVPDSVVTTEYILSEDGERKYNTDTMSYDVNFEVLNRTAVLTLKPNYATALSSSISADYALGAIIKGFSVVCTWGDDECEYGFAILGDAAFTDAPLVDSVTVVIWKNEDGQDCFTLSDGASPPSPSQLSGGRVFDGVDGLNAELGNYRQDAISTVYVKHTMDFSKNEVMALTDMIVVPSSDYSMTTGLYEYIGVIPLSGLRALAALGDDLLFEDFAGYKGADVGSGLYILQFDVEGGYSLLVGGGSPTGKPLYAVLSAPGFEGGVDIRNDDVDEFIGRYPVPEKISNEVSQYLDIIMSSPLFSSASGDYIKAHQAEYNAILDMRIPALPTLIGILNSGDRGLRGVIASLAITDIVEREAGREADREAGHDTGREAEYEAGRDTGQEAEYEAERGAEHEAGLEAEYEAGRDTGHEAGLEASGQDSEWAIGVLQNATAAVARWSRGFEEF